MEIIRITIVLATVRAGMSDTLNINDMNITFSGLQFLE